MHVIHPSGEPLEIRWGREVAARRRLLHMTQVELAERVGTDQGTISRIEHGKHMFLHHVMMERIAGALSCPVPDLFAWPKTKPPMPSSEQVAS